MIKCRRRRMHRLCVLVMISCSAGLHGQADQARSIVPESFLKARPASPEEPGPQTTYRRVTRVHSSDDESISEIGVTIWKLRPAVATDTTRLLVQEPQGTSVEWTPVRIETGTPLAVGDRVRIGIESPEDGYLYVIDRERYADGSIGEPYLIFPTTLARGGDNRMAAGRLIEIPAQTDRPPHFTLRPSRPDQVAELITVLIAREPLPGVAPGPGHVALSREVVAAWEKQGGVIADELEMVGGSGRTWSEEEQRAGADATRLLTQQDPAPQTVFRIATSSSDLVAAQFSLTHVPAGGSGSAPR